MSLRLASQNPDAVPLTAEQKAARRRGILFGSWVDQTLRAATMDKTYLVAPAASNKPKPIIPWQGLYEQLSAIETLAVGRQGPGLSHRGERVLRWLQHRMTRHTPTLTQPTDRSAAE